MDVSVSKQKNEEEKAIEDEDEESVESSSRYPPEWIEIQDSLKRKLVLEDDFTWTIPKLNSSGIYGSESKILRYIGGADVSFLKEEPSTACGALVIIDASNLSVIHEEFEIVQMQLPYVPGFLAFREAPIILGLLDKMKKSNYPFYPQLLMVDGNGVLHPRGFGLACHVGVLADLPSIGIGKNLHHVDGITKSAVRKLHEASENSDAIPLTGISGRQWGVAFHSSPGSLRPVYISTGHRISLDSAVKIVRLSCKFRVPEPVRQADQRSRALIRSLLPTKANDKRSN